MRFPLPLFAFTFLCPGFAAHADVIHTFNVSATAMFAGASTADLVNGTISIDYTNLYATVGHFSFQSNTPPVSLYHDGPYTDSWDGLAGLHGRTSGPSLNLFDFVFLNSVGDELELQLNASEQFPSYMGGPICTINNYMDANQNCDDDAFYHVLGYSELYFDNSDPEPFVERGGPEPFTSGTATLVTTPEPSSLALLALGVLGLCGAIRLRLSNRTRIQ